MKTIISILAIVIVCAGCATTNNPWPGETKIAAFIATDNALHDNPANRSEIELVENIVCAVAGSVGTNSSPAALVTALDKVGTWRPATRTFILTITLIAEQAVNANPTSPAGIYLKAACDGMTWATTTPSAGTGRSAKTSPARDKWPQIK